MCGIAGIVSRDVLQIDPRIEQMTAVLRHRGPDDSGIARLEKCHLGHRRLSVIDLQTGHQPMVDETERYWIVFNGEIFNYRELRDDLRDRGRRFRTQSDTEVLLMAYQEYGETVAEHLNGQFAFAIWDNEEERLFAARDRLGEKPLYWALTPAGELLFGSEIKALLAAGAVTPKLDMRSLHAYLALLYVPPDRTIYSNINTLRPAHAMAWKGGQIRQWRYWQPKYSASDTFDLPEAASRCRSLIERAVKRQMVSDVTVGAFLSGGVDSSTVVAMMCNAQVKPVKTFSVGFGDTINELPWARLVAEKYKTDHYEIKMDISVGEMLEQMAVTYDEPFADSSNIPTFLMSEFASRHVKVVLAGDGADELFGGYEWYRHLLASDLDDIGPTRLTLMRMWMNTLRTFVKAGFSCRLQRDRAMENYKAVLIHRENRRPIDRHVAFVSNWDDDPDLFETLKKTYCGDVHDDTMDQVASFDVGCYLAGDILVKVDRAAMAHGLETRSPFLDVDLVEYALSLPWSLRFTEGEQKALLRYGCADLWPPPIRSRRKHGFGAPIREWMKLPDVADVWHRVTAPGSRLAAVLPDLPARTCTRDPQRLWTLLCLGLWLEKHSCG
jgi:asparagine synthase (glutamine-hydrolysing)